MVQLLHFEPNLEGAVKGVAGVNLGLKQQPRRDEQPVRSVEPADYGLVPGVVLVQTPGLSEGLPVLPELGEELFILD